MNHEFSFYSKNKRKQASFFLGSVDDFPQGSQYGGEYFRIIFYDPPASVKSLLYLKTNFTRTPFSTISLWRAQKSVSIAVSAHVYFFECVCGYVFVDVRKKKKELRKKTQQHIF